MDSFLLFASKNCLLIVIFLIYFYLVIQLLLLLFPYEPSGGFQTLPNIVTNKHKTMGLKNVTQIYYPLQTNLLK